MEVATLPESHTADYQQEWHMITHWAKPLAAMHLAEAANGVRCGVSGNRTVAVHLGAVCGMLAKSEGLYATV